MLKNENDTLELAAMSLKLQKTQMYFWKASGEFSTIHAISRQK